MEEVLRWVKFGRRLPPKVGQYCTPIHNRYRPEYDVVGEGYDDVKIVRETDA
jgi:hypothetical protein